MDKEKRTEGFSLAYGSRGIKVDDDEPGCGGAHL